MRFLSVILILAGLAIAFALPIYQKDFSGEPIETVRVFDRSLGGWASGWQDREVRLTADGGPYRVRLEGDILPGQTGLPATLPVFVELVGEQGTVFSGEFEFGVREENPKTGEAAPHLFLSLPEFDVLADGTYTLSARILTGRDISLASLDATIAGNAEASNHDFTPAGLGVFGLGTVLYLVSGRRRKKQRAKEESRHRWGRQ